MKKCWHLTNYKAGHLAEKVALLFLMMKGYWPVKMNYMIGRGTGAGEVDLIVKKGNTLVFVEVKKRPDEQQAKEAVRPKNQERLMRSAQVFLSRYPQYQNYEIRYDVMWVSPHHFPKHIKSAWYPFLFLFCFLLSGCGIWTSLINVGHSVGIIVADDQPLSQDATDIEIYTVIKQKLAEKEINTLLDVQVTVFGGRVLLTGALPNMDLIATCVETAWQQKDVQYVYNYIRLGETLGFVDTSQEAVSASSLRNQLALTEGIKSSNYKIVLENGVVYVMGLKKDKAEWENAQNVIKQTYGVNDIVYLMQDL